MAKPQRLSENDALVGRRVGNYVIQSILGTGGMGSVYLAEHPEIGRRMAIKVLSERHDEETEARFLAEARILASLQHPNIVEIYDFGYTDAAGLYIVMESLLGSDLQTLLDATGKLSIEAAVDCGRQICAALAAAHQRGVVHRDLKPANVFVLESDTGMIDSQFNRVKVLDFGLAKVLEQDDNALLTRPGVLFGTPLCMSPEQALGRRDAIGPPTDVYALGVILFQMLCGRPPFVETASLQLLLRHVHDAPPRLDALKPNIQPELCEIVAQCLAKERQARPTAEHLFQQLTQVARGRPQLDRTIFRSPRGVGHEGPAPLSSHPTMAPGRSPRGVGHEGPAPLSSHPTMAPGWLSNERGTIVGSDFPDDDVTEPPVESDSWAGPRAASSVHVERIECPFFVGREAELAALRARLRDARLITLFGPVGSGRSQLAEHYLRHRSGLDLAAWWRFDCASATSCEQALARIAEVLGLAPEPDNDATIATIGRWLAERGPTVLLLTDLDFGSSELQRVPGKWLQQADALRVIVTAQSPLDLEAGLAQPISTLEIPQAVELFFHWATELDTSFCLHVPHDAWEVRELVARVDAMPLAVRVLATAVDRASCNQILELLASTLGDARDLTRSSQQGPVMAALELHWSLLSEAEKQAAAFAADQHGSFLLTTGSRSVRTDGDPEELKEIAERLSLRGIVDRMAGPCRYWMHPAIAAFVSQLGRSDDAGRR